jgi:hypothetical protein
VTFTDWVTSRWNDEATLDERTRLLHTLSGLLATAVNLGEMVSAPGVSTF